MMIRLTDYRLRAISILTSLLSADIFKPLNSRTVTKPLAKTVFKTFLSVKLRALWGSPYEHNHTYVCMHTHTDTPLQNRDPFIPMGVFPKDRMEVKLSNPSDAVACWAGRRRAPGMQTCTHNTFTHTLAQSAEVSGYLTVDLRGDGGAFAVQREEVRGRVREG